MKRWWRRRRFIKAYKMLRDESERHIAAGHDMMFIAVNEAYIKMHCVGCSDLQP